MSRLLTLRCRFSTYQPLITLTIPIFIHVIQRICISLLRTASSLNQPQWRTQHSQRDWLSYLESNWEQHTLYVDDLVSPQHDVNQALLHGRKHVFTSYTTYSPLTTRATSCSTKLQGNGPRTTRTIDTAVIHQIRMFDTKRSPFPNILTVTITHPSPINKEPSSPPS